MQSDNGWLIRSYERVGWRRVPLVISGLGVLVGTVLGLGVIAVPLLGYLDADAKQYWTTFAMGMGAGLTGSAVTAVMAFREWQPVGAWLEDPASGVSAEDAWATAAFLPLRMCARAGGFALVVGGIPMVLYWASEFDLSAWATIAGWIGGAISTACMMGALAAVGEIVLSPVIARIAVELPGEWRRPDSRWTVGPKLLTAFAAVAVAVGIGVGGVLPADSEPGTRLASAVFVSLAGVVILLPGILVVAHAILDPLRQLRAGTIRVAQGDLSTPVPPTTADEFGDVSASFNRLQDRVREQFDELRASRTRIVEASDAERRRVERNLHDGAQQRLVALALKLRMLEERATADPELQRLAVAASHDLAEALDELRELARGLHPQVLSTGGLAPALEQLAQRSTVPINVDIPRERYPEAVEATAYFVVSEALANVAKYSQAKTAEVSAERRNGRLVLAVRDDGVGGAEPAPGSGLAGLADRVAALNGDLRVESPAGAGTNLTVELPLGAEQ